jgi:hypothetical protein
MALPIRDDCGADEEQDESCDSHAKSTRFAQVGKDCQT